MWPKNSTSTLGKVIIYTIAVLKFRKAALTLCGQNAVSLSKCRWWYRTFLSGYTQGHVHLIPRAEDGYCINISNRGAEKWDLLMPPVHTPCQNMLMGSYDQIRHTHDHSSRNIDVIHDSCQQLNLWDTKMPTLDYPFCKCLYDYDSFERTILRDLSVVTGRYLYISMTTWYYVEIRWRNTAIPSPHPVLLRNS